MGIGDRDEVEALMKKEATDGWSWANRDPEKDHSDKLVWSNGENIEGLTNAN